MSALWNDVLFLKQFRFGIPTAPWRCHGGNRDKLCWLSHKKTFDEFVDRFGLLAPEVLDHSSDKKSKANGKGVQSVANLASYPLKSLQEQNFTIPVQPVNFSFKPGATSDTVAETVSSHKLNNGRNGLGFVRQPVMDWGVGVTIERKRKEMKVKRVNLTEQSYAGKNTESIEDRAVEHKNQVVGMTRTLVFHIGKAPKGDRTDWVMHEFRLEDKNLADKGIAQNSYVTCRVFQKEGPGPRNGAHYD
ncbi:hypothetical protein KIW84_053966 [Lathyrus oleraceus]|uniref:NAC domain-containing protein n=1 Tax=Pisum sativum TaxID=3888 RepID=A0A9D4WWD1_PEA|nr:hypothetical protein KIW84_053966 [Pisum sativum]